MWRFQYPVVMRIGKRSAIYRRGQKERLSTRFPPDLCSSRDPPNWTHGQVAVSMPRGRSPGTVTTVGYPVESSGMPRRLQVARKSEDQPHCRSPKAGIEPLKNCLIQKNRNGKIPDLFTGRSLNRIGASFVNHRVIYESYRRCLFIGADAPNPKTPPAALATSVA